MGTQRPSSAGPRLLKLEISSLLVVDPTENVYPMIEAGKGHHEMHLSPESELV